MCTRFFHGLIPTLGLATLMLIPLSTQADTARTGSRARALGGAFHALSNDNSSVTYNPAGLVRHSRFSFRTLYELERFSEVDLGDGRTLDPEAKTWEASITDSTTVPVGGGLGYARTEFRAPFSADGETERITFRRDDYFVTYSQVLGGWFTYGTTLHYINTDSQRTTRRTLMTSDFGVTIGPPSGILLVGLAGHNLIWDGERDMEGFSRHDREYVVALSSYLANILTVAGEWAHNVDSKADDPDTWRFGAELFLKGQFALRGGYETNGIEERDYYSWGVGWMAPRLALGFALRQDPDDSSAREMTFDLQINYAGGR